MSGGDCSEMAMAETTSRDELPRGGKWDGWAGEDGATPWGAFLPSRCRLLGCFRFLLRLEVTAEMDTEEVVFEVEAVIKENAEEAESSVDVREEKAREALGMEVRDLEKRGRRGSAPCSRMPMLREIWSCCSEEGAADEREGTTAG